MTAPLVLASRSAVRAGLLRSAGLSFTVQVADVDERGLEAKWASRDVDPAATAVALAEAKALAASELVPEAIVIGADQTMALGAERFTKARDRAEAFAALKHLSGRTHHLYSGYAVAQAGQILATGVAKAAMTMRELSDAALNAYLDRAGDAVLMSVGCYQLENLGVTLFEAIEGDYFTILGLPMLPLLEDLRSAGVEGL